MKKLNVLLLITSFLVAYGCGNEPGKKLKSSDIVEVSIDSLIHDASALEGKTVKFEANVDHACMHGGKRLTVFGSEIGKTLKIDGTEKSPRFESSLINKKVEVTGVVKKVAGTHIADCEEEEGKVTPEVAYVIECIDYSVK